MKSDSLSPLGYVEETERNDIMILLKMTEDLASSIVGILSSDFFADCSGKYHGKEERKVTQS